jgi:alkanesulfonate monooxygenase SsuD/methylene tetrahydromethanopterin reductase-like flavin-dependent oxidoreductase (luciferase family)
MKLSLFSEVQCPPGAEPAARLQEVLEQAEVADGLGYHGLWLAEIHFQPRFSALSAPYVVLGALTQRTRRLRLGVAVNILPVNHPLHLAEQAATLDVLSGGRMEFAVGRGHPHSRVYEGYGAERGVNRDAFQEAVEVIRRAWAEDELVYQGRYYRVPGVVLNPKPLQRPGPPLLLATSSADGVEQAAQLGLDLLLPVHTIDRGRLYDFAATYWQALDAHGHGRAQRELGLLLPMHLAATDAEARARAEHGLMDYYEVLRYTRNDYRNWLDRRGLGGQPFPQAPWEGMTFERAVSQHAILGSPASARSAIQELVERTGASHLLCWMNVGSIPHPLVLESMRLFAHELLPELAAR